MNAKAISGSGPRAAGSPKPTIAQVAFRAEGFRVPLEDGDLDPQGQLTPAGWVRVERVAHGMAVESFRHSNSGNVEFIRLLDK